MRIEWIRDNKEKKKKMSSSRISKNRKWKSNNQASLILMKSKDNEK
jgi:hypothetical protein